MMDSFTMALNKVHNGVGQGSILEQIDKRYHKQQRITLFKMLEKVENKDVEYYPVTLYKHIGQKGKRTGGIDRSSIPIHRDPVGIQEA